MMLRYHFIVLHYSSRNVFRMSSCDLSKDNIRLKLPETVNTKRGSCISSLTYTVVGFVTILILKVMGSRILQNQAQGTKKNKHTITILALYPLYFVYQVTVSSLGGGGGGG